MTVRNNIYNATCAAKKANPSVSPVGFNEQLCFMVQSTQNTNWLQKYTHNSCLFVCGQIRAKICQRTVILGVINTWLSIGAVTDTLMPQINIPEVEFSKHLKLMSKTKLTKNVLRYELQDKSDIQPRLEIIFIRYFLPLLKATTNGKHLWKFQAENLSQSAHIPLSWHRAIGCA